jgi:AcrR family transcriptional regulator
MAQEAQRRTPAGHRRRAELMEAAVMLAADNGFGRTRVSDIVGRVGVGQGVFYWYFESKDALFREIFEDTTRRLRFYQGAFIANEPDPILRIAKGIVASFDFIVRNAHVFALLDHEQGRLRRTRRDAGRIHMLDTARHITEATQTGLIRPMDPTFPATAISGVVNQLARDYFASGGGDFDHVVQEAVDFCLGGLLGAQTVRVEDLRADVELTRELKQLRDKVGAASDGARSRPGRSSPES